MKTFKIIYIIIGVMLAAGVLISSLAGLPRRIVSYMKQLARWRTAERTVSGPALV